MILIYLLKVSACTTLFFAVYHFLLVRFTFFNLNRIYLLLTLLLSFSIPALTVKSEHKVVVAAKASIAAVAYSNNGGFMEKDIVDDGSYQNISVDWSKMLAYAYYSILVILACRMFFMIGRVRNQLRKNMIDQTNNIILVDKNSIIKNCSFFNRIVVDSSLPPNERMLVIRHESIHVEQLHAFDKLLVNLITAILWFNPIIYFWRNAIDHNHEFLADREMSKVTDKRTYASLLLNLAMPSKNLVTNSFSKLPLKNRIAMLYKEQNKKLQRLAYLVIIPVGLICCVAFVNRKEVIVEQKISVNQSQSDLVQKSSVFAMNYLNDNIPVNPNATSAFKEVEIKLIVDAGHGGKDNAAVALDGQKEKDLNLRAVKILEEEAAKRGIKVTLTRTTDQFLSLRDRLPQQNATAFISIHHNAASSVTRQLPFNGIEVYVSKLNKNIKMSEDLGIGILNNLKKLEGTEVRDSLKDANLLLLRESKIPAVLIEMGDISDERSLNYINQEKNIRRISNLILDGFVQFSKRGC